MNESASRPLTENPRPWSVDLDLDGGKVVSGPLLVFDFRGFAMGTEQIVPVGTACTVTLHPGGRGAAEPEVFAGRIGDVDDRGLRIDFHPVPGDRARLKELLSQRHGEAFPAPERIG